MPVFSLKGVAQAVVCASWVVPPQLTKLRLSAAVAVPAVMAISAVAITAVAVFLNTILLALVVVFVRKRAFAMPAFQGAVAHQGL